MRHLGGGTRPAPVTPCSCGGRDEQRAARLKNDFLSAVSHELRSPLNPILGWSELLVDGELDPATAHLAHQAILRNAQALSDLVERVLELSQLLAAEECAADEGEADLSAILEGVVSRCRDAAAARDVRLIHDICARPLVMEGASAAQLAQAFFHLVSHAVSITPAGGTVELLCVHHGPDARVSVRDGRPPLALARLQEVVDPLDGGSVAARREDGLGLALAFARRVVELHRGKLSVTSTADAGACTRVALPVSRLRVAEPAAPLGAE